MSEKCEGTEILYQSIEYVKQTLTRIEELEQTIIYIGSYQIGLTVVGFVVMGFFLKTLKDLFRDTLEKTNKVQDSVDGNLKEITKLLHQAELNAVRHDGKVDYLFDRMDIKKKKEY